MQDDYTISEYRQALKSKILEATMTAFTSQGIRAVKMDDIANSLSISKRTLYELYSNKEDLLFECVKKYHAIRRDQMRRFAEDGSHNVMDIILYAFRQKVEEIKSTTPQFYSDMEKYPKLLRFFEHEKAATKQKFVDFLRRGTAEGYFCPNLNHELVASIIDVQNQFVMGNKLYKQYSMQAVFFNLIHLSLRGLCTQRGIEVLDRFINDYHEQA